MQLLKTFWLVLFCMALNLGAQTTTNKTNIPNRLISLEEAIELALRGNLGLEVARVNLLLTHYQVSFAYSAYEPFFSASGIHNYRVTPSGLLDPQGRVIPSSRSESDSFSAGIGGPGVGVSGLLPSGLTYSLSGSASDSVFHRPFLNTNGSIIDTRAETSQGAVTLNMRQPLLKNSWIDDTRRAIKVAKLGVDSASLELRWQIMGVINNVAKNYYELIYTRESIKVAEASLELAEKLVGENKKRVEVGTMAPLDEKSAESDAAQRRADLINAQKLHANQQNLLKALLTGNYQVIHDVELMPSEDLTAPVPVINVQASWGRALSERPDLLETRVFLEQWRIEVRYSHNQLFPELDLVGSYGFTGAGQEYSGAFGQIGSGNNPNYSVGAVLTIPLGNTAARSTYKDRQERKRLALLASKTLEQRILIEIDNAAKNVLNYYQSIDAAKEARDYAATALSAEQKKLESGKSTSYDVLQRQRDLRDRQVAEIRALANFNEALSDLYYQEASILDRHNIRMEAK